MQWNHEKNDGFSDGNVEDQYLPLDSDPDRPTVEDQMKDENSLWHTIQDLIELRKQTPALQASGHLTFENVDYPLMYSREKDRQKILVVLNPSVKDANVEIKHPINQVLFKIGKDMKEKDGVWIVPGESAFVLKVE